MEYYGYVRVSAKDQNPDRQIDVMIEQKIKQDNIFVERMSGKDFVRPQYKQLLKKLKAGDVLIIKSIDRLGRDYAEILEQWRKITKEIGANIRVLDMPLLNTDSSHDDLTGLFISDLVLQILAYVAETERGFIRKRQAEGIAAARKRGICFGRKRSDIPKKFEEYYHLWEAGEISLRQAAIELEMSYSTFYRRCKEWKKENEK